MNAQGRKEVQALLEKSERGYPMKRESGWKCRGYGSWHGYRKGRHWFACSACRWPSVVD